MEVLVRRGGGGAAVCQQIIVIDIFAVDLDWES